VLVPRNRDRRWSIRIRIREKNSRKTQFEFEKSFTGKRGRFEFEFEKSFTGKRGSIRIRIREKNSRKTQFEFEKSFTGKRGSIRIREKFYRVEGVNSNSRKVLQGRGGQFEFEKSFTGKRGSIRIREKFYREEGVNSNSNSGKTFSFQFMRVSVRVFSFHRLYSKSNPTATRSHGKKGNTATQ